MIPTLTPLIPLKGKTPTHCAEATSPLEPVPNLYSGGLRGVGGLTKNSVVFLPTLY